MAKSHATSRGRSFLVTQVEFLEGRGLLSGLGGMHPLHEPFPQSAELPAAIRFSPTPTASTPPASLKGAASAQRSTPMGEPVAPPSAAPSQASHAVWLRAAPPSESARLVGAGSGTSPGRGATPVVDEPGTRSVGREDPPVHASNEIATPPGRAVGAGRAYGLATANEHAAAGVGKEKAGPERGTAGSGNERTPPGLLQEEVNDLAPSTSAPAGDPSSVPAQGRPPFDPPATGTNLGSTASRPVRLNSGSDGRTLLLLPRLPVPIDWRHIDLDLLGMLSIRNAGPSEVESRDSPAPSETAHQGRAQAADSSHRSSGDGRFVPRPDNLAIASAMRSTRHGAKPSPEVADLEAEPASDPVQALLRELEKLRDQLQSAGEYASDWLFDREVSDWILLALVVAVTAEIARREFWRREVDPSLVDGEGSPFPWMVEDVP